MATGKSRASTDLRSQLAWVPLSRESRLVVYCCWLQVIQGVAMIIECRIPISMRDRLRSDCDNSLNAGPP